MSEEQAIQSGYELRNWFHNNRKSKIVESGIYVSTKIRKEILLSVDSNRITLDGKIQDIIFDDMKGGVWKAYITRSK